MVLNSKRRLILFHFKRDLRIKDNSGLHSALKVAHDLTRLGVATEVLPIFIFDRAILDRLTSRADARVSFIFHQVLRLKERLKNHNSDLRIFYGKATEELQKCYGIYQKDYQQVDYYGNYDDDPYPLRRDQSIRDFIQSKGGEFHLFKDHHIFSRGEILNKAHLPYTVFTPYRRAWLEKIQDSFYLKSYPTENYLSFLKKGSFDERCLSLKDMGFQTVDVRSWMEPRWNDDMLAHYQENRDFPAREGTSQLGVHLRFGTVSIRELVRESFSKSETFVSELIWRDFFAQILFHFPRVVQSSFRDSYDRISWRKDEEEFSRWKEGTTGFPLVDAGMRELLSTGTMHNRVRMVTASFLCKHLLHYWLEGERWFASHLMDYDLASNNGNWQWAAGSGCDAAPYFRIFNPVTQQEKFDKDFNYIKKWVPELGTTRYPSPMIDHEWARARALSEYKKGLLKAGRYRDSD